VMLREKVNGRPGKSVSIEFVSRGGWGDDEYGLDM